MLAFLDFIAKNTFALVVSKHRSSYLPLYLLLFTKPLKPYLSQQKRLRIISKNRLPYWLHILIFQLRTEPHVMHVGPRRVHNPLQQPVRMVQIVRTPLHHLLRRRITTRGHLLRLGIQGRRRQRRLPRRSERRLRGAARRRRPVRGLRRSVGRGRRAVRGYGRCLLPLELGRKPGAEPPRRIGEGDGDKQTGDDEQALHRCCWWWSVVWMRRRAVFICGIWQCRFQDGVVTWFRW